MTKPTSFSPVFNPTVFIGLVPFTFSIKPVYCLTDGSAQILAAILADLKPTIVEADPQLGAVRWHYSQTVPWLKFPDGTMCNAGQLAEYWRAKPNDDGDLVTPDFAVAERNCRLDITAAMDITRQLGFNIGV